MGEDAGKWLINNQLTDGLEWVPNRLPTVIKSILSTRTFFCGNSFASGVR
jgi:hypothetical protein